MATMVGQVLESHKIIFHEDEISSEGLNHNRALHITMQFENNFIARVLIDGGSSLNICPLDTLKRLGKGFHETWAGSMNMKAFDGSQRAMIGEINICLQMGPTWFDVEFQVLDIPALHNLLLGRPWIHTVGAVASTLHQAVKFEWNHQEVIIYGDGSNHIYTSQTIPVIGNRKRYTWKEYNDWSPLWRGPYYPLEQPVPHLGQTFHQDDTIWGTAIEEEALAGLRNLFLEDEDMVYSAIIEEEEEEGLTIRTVEKGVVLRNWTVIPSLARRVPGIIITFPNEPVTVTCNEATQHKDSDSDEEYEIPEEIVREVENIETKPKSNLDEIEAVNLGNVETVKETRISIHLSPMEKEVYIHFLKEYEDIFARSYDDMTGLSTSIVAHNLPSNPMCPPVKQKLRKFKLDMSLKIKEEVTNQIKPKVLRVVEYPTWLANIVPVPMKDEKVRVCVDYRYLNRASPKDDFPLPNIQILIDNCAKHELQSFVDFFAGYHQIWMDEEDVEKIAFITYGGILLQNDAIWSKHSPQLCEPIFKMLRKDAETSWIEDYQKVFDKSRNTCPYHWSWSHQSWDGLCYSIYLYWMEPSDVFWDNMTRQGERSKKLRHYFCAYTTYLISRMGHLKYIFQKPMPTGKLAKWQILLNEFNIVYVTQKAVKGQAFGRSSC
ncbi:uncharacterized protein [Nicotiana sylvestris]|uniref:uncharacterized protein n=1 Tax=Nicotiana sylvestris TaxID=4096 RepID=UPI00388C8F13